MHTSVMRTDRSNLNCDAPFRYNKRPVLWDNVQRATYIFFGEWRVPEALGQEIQPREETKDFRARVQ
jgi:hypothetical protein